MQCLGKHIVLTDNRFWSNSYVIKEVTMRLELGGTTETLVSTYTPTWYQSSEYQNISSSTK
jgi:hypothetical protein